MIKTKRNFQHAGLVWAALIAVSLAAGVESAAAQDDKCDICYQQTEAKCKEICVSAGPNAEQCGDACLRVKCQDKCWMQTVEPELDKKVLDPNASTGKGVTAACEACMRQMEKGKCGPPCDDKEDPVTCRQRCAKFNCSRKCGGLPGRVVEEDEEVIDKKKTAAECRLCKGRSQIPCEEKCGPKDRPGFFACTVGCVEQKCFETCQPGLF